MTALSKYLRTKLGEGGRGESTRPANAEVAPSSSGAARETSAVSSTMADISFTANRNQRPVLQTLPPRVLLAPVDYFDREPSRPCRNLRRLRPCVLEDIGRRCFH